MSESTCGVYLVRAGDHCKIGMSANVQSRIASLQTANPMDLELMATVEVRDAAAAKILEGALHVRAKEVGSRVRGEWFEYQPAILVEALVCGDYHHCGQGSADEELSSYDEMLAALMDDLYREGFPEDGGEELLCPRLPYKPWRLMKSVPISRERSFTRIEIGLLYDRRTSEHYGDVAGVYDQYENGTVRIYTSWGSAWYSPATLARIESAVADANLFTVIES